MAYSDHDKTAIFLWHIKIDIHEKSNHSFRSHYFSFWS